MEGRKEGGLPGVSADLCQEKKAPLKHKVFFGQVNTLLGFFLENEGHHSLTFISFMINPPKDFGRGLEGIDIWRMGTGLWKVQGQHGSATWFKCCL